MSVILVITPKNTPKNFCKKQVLKGIYNKVERAVRKSSQEKCLKFCRVQRDEVLNFHDYLSL